MDIIKNVMIVTNQSTQQTKNAVLGVCKVSPDLFQLTCEFMKRKLSNIERDKTYIYPATLQPKKTQTVICMIWKFYPQLPKHVYILNNVVDSCWVNWFDGRLSFLPALKAKRWRNSFTNCWNSITTVNSSTWSTLSMRIQWQFESLSQTISKGTPWWGALGWKWSTGRIFRPNLKKLGEVGWNEGLCIVLKGLLFLSSQKIRKITLFVWLKIGQNTSNISDFLWS